MRDGKPGQWAVIEMAGMARGECIVRVFDGDTPAAGRGPAEDWLFNRYDEDERDELHPDVAHWDAEGGFWSYDH